MKRVGNLYEKMSTRQNMQLAYAGVMKDKHGKRDPGSKAFMIIMNKDYYIHEAGRLIEEHLFKPSKPKESYRYDKGSGKLRKIQAPKLFPDQFVHWAMMLVMQPIFMRGMDDWCCASVKGRGTLYAKKFLEKTLDPSNDENKKIPTTRKYKYCLKMDIRKFFDSISREILMKKLHRKFKDKDLLDLCHKIIYSIPGKVGIPIGYYTSQWFANFYLQDFDHYLREKLMPKYGVSIYVRYMDDMIILGSNKRKLKQLMNEIELYLDKEMELELKNTSSIFSIADRDIDFIGYRFSYGKTTLRKRTLHRIKLANNNLYKGKFTIKKLRTMGAYNGWIVNSDTKEYVNANLEGNRKLEQRELGKALAKQRDEYYRSKTFNRLVDVATRIEQLRDKTENHDGHVLIRYYKDRDECRVVSRCRFKFKDEEKESSVKHL